MGKHSKLVSTSLTDDLVIEILLWLPVKSLLRSKCLSKKWHQVITSPYFIKLHLNKSTNNVNNEALLILSSSSLYSTSMDALIGDMTRLNFPFGINNEGNNLVLSTESCNGLVCIRNEGYPYAGFGCYEFVLYNPATRAHKLLPRIIPFTLPLPRNLQCDMNMWCSDCGFGYDHETDDYKMVMIVNYYPADYIYKHQKGYSYHQVHMYSLRKNSWKKVENVSNRSFEYPGTIGGLSPRGALANNALHWLSSERCPGSRRRIITGIALHNGQHRDLPGPEIEETYTVESLSTLGGCLQLTTMPGESLYTDFDVWLMKEYGSEESWTRWLRIEIPDNKRFASVSTIGYLEGRREAILVVSGEVCGLTEATLLGDEKRHFPGRVKKFLHYNLDQKAAKQVDLPYFHDVIPYVPSLVPLDDMPSFV